MTLKPQKMVCRKVHGKHLYVDRTRVAAWVDYIWLVYIWFIQDINLGIFSLILAGIKIRPMTALTALAAITKHHRLGGLNCRNSFSHSSEGTGQIWALIRVLWLDCRWGPTRLTSFYLHQFLRDLISKYRPCWRWHFNMNFERIRTSSLTFWPPKSYPS